MSKFGKPCYAHTSPYPAYKYQGRNPIYSTSHDKEFGEITITFSWPSDAKDLDICGYWDDDLSGTKVGYGYNASAGTYGSGDLAIRYSGDIKTSGGSEWVVIQPRTSDTETVFVMYFNFYGYDAKEYPGNTCTVYVRQDGKVLTKQQICKTDTGKPAPSSGEDYRARLIIDAGGELTLTEN